MPVPPLSGPALAALTRIEALTLIEPEDGMGAQLTRLPPGAPLHPEALRGSEGQFLFVTAGTLQHGGVTLGRWENLFLSAGDAALPLRAGPGGAEVVAMHIPFKDAAYA